MFCSKCGNPVDDGSSFCTQCGAKLVTEGTAFSFQPNTTQSSSDYTLTITRQKKFTGCGQKAKVTINGMERGTLKNGQKNTYTVESLIIDVKISMLGVLSSLHLKLRLDSNAHIQFEINNVVLRGLWKVSLVNISGATIIE